ncbi:hypothetical protein B0T22DRAFT_504497 [Podospora appendiculata]|uniref:Uncharacterized protein n=1 Tax=Podospora appendiculata TaxID=314037 RepID=A0AAE0XH25_9PEZI|nr:hypothetical protein B0T22DRAFT_504497 [Podospora appendiculata]
MLLFPVGLALALLVRRSSAAPIDATCQCIGVDYTDSGSYLIDSSVDSNFSFASELEGNCGNTTISTSLRDENGNSYACSPITPTAPGIIQISTCDIPYSNMTTGIWEILIRFTPDLLQTRTFQLTVGAPATVVTTPPTTIIQTSIAIQNTTDRQVTSSTTTVSTVTAICKYTTTITAPSSPTITSAPQPAPTGAFTVIVSGSTCVVASQGWNGFSRPGGRGGGWGGGWRGGPPPWLTSMWASAGHGGFPPWISCISRTAALAPRTALPRMVAAWTSTYTQTTFTATQTSTSYLPAVTATVFAIETVTQTITPAATTNCLNWVRDTTKTVTEPGARLTTITVVTLVNHVTETVFVT